MIKKTINNNFINFTLDFLFRCRFNIPNVFFYIPTYTTVYSILYSNIHSEFITCGNFSLTNADKWY